MGRILFSALMTLIVGAVLLMQAGRAPACLNFDGSLPPFGGSGPNMIAADEINLAHKIAKMNGLETPITPPVHGSHKTVIILIENAAAGAPFRTAFRAASLWHNRLVQIDNYYNQVSRGILRVVAAAETHGTVNDGVIGPVTVSGLSSSTSGGNLYAAAVKAANPYINYAAFDTNGDGKIVSTELHILIYQAGYEGAYGSPPTPNCWGHTSWNTGGLSGITPATDSDGKKITSYCYAGSTFYNSASSIVMATQGVMTHEFGHDIGLPDLYDTDGSGSGGDSEGLGWFCLMSSGNWAGSSGDSPTHIDAYYKNWLGWENQSTLLSPVNQVRTLYVANGNNHSLRINVSGSTQFFIVENRQQTGFDAGLPGTLGGLIIYHCNGTILGGTGAINNNPTNMGIKVEEADGDNDIIVAPRNRGEQTDLFRAGNNVTFNYSTNPNSRLNSGANSYVNIWKIPASSNVMTFNVGTVAPTISYFAINYNAAATTSRIVTLNNICIDGTPVAYQASESSSFSGASWLAYSSAPSFLLSTNNVTKAVYFRVKNSLGQISTTRADSIRLEEITTLPISSTWLSDAIEPATEVKWYRLTVTTARYYNIDTIAGTLTDNTMKLYASNRTTLLATDDDSGAGFMARIIRYFATGTYYVRIAAYNTSAGHGTYAIRATPVVVPQPTSFKINNGAPNTSSRYVVLNNTTINNPTEYMASENNAFTGATWLAYSAAPRFTIASAGNGVKTIYFKVRNAAGQSSTWGDTINLQEITLKALIVYKSDVTALVSIANFLTSVGISPTRYLMGSTLPDLKPFHVIILATDSGDMDSWGTSTLIASLVQSGKPIVGLGEGGYAFFGKLSLPIGYPKGAHGSFTSIVVVDGSQPVFSVPRYLTSSTGATFALYATTTPAVTIYLPSIPSTVIALGRQYGSQTYYPVLMCYPTRVTVPRYALWGFTGTPTAMTTAGKYLFENLIRFTASQGSW